MELWRLLEAAGGRLDGWDGATLMINVHPACRKLPKDVPVVIAHGANDTTFPRSREQLQHLVETGGHANALLYYTSGGGGPPRNADSHVMASLLVADCLPRLLDCVTAQPPGSGGVCLLALKSSYRLFLNSFALIGTPRAVTHELMDLISA